MRESSKSCAVSAAYLLVSIKSISNKKNKHNDINKTVWGYRITATFTEKERQYQGRVSLASSFMSFQNKRTWPLG